MILVYADVCAGISAATLAWKPLGWRAAFYSEIEKFPSAVLAHRHPDTPNLGDMTKWRDWTDAAFDVLVGGTPCQGFSVAGLRKGLDDPRSRLAYDYLGIAGRYRPTWFVWENVPGARSAWSGAPDDIGDGERWEGDETSDLDQFVAGMVECGYGVAVAILDLQYFGPPQRRERIVAVGYLGDWRPAAAVLFDAESLRGDSPPRRTTGQGTAGTVTASLGKRGGVPQADNAAGELIAADVASCLNSHFGDKLGLEDQHINQGAPLFVAHALTGEGHDASEDGTGRGTPIVPVACSGRRATRWAVRRLTPRECERLMGMPDDYTLIPWRGKPVDQCPDGPRYKALGNSIGVPMLTWIGRRIELCSTIIAETGWRPGE